MAHVLANLVEQTSTSRGLTTIALSGAAKAPFRNFADVLSDGDTTEVVIVNNDRRNEWQVAVYSYSGGVLTLVRFSDSGTGAPIDFGGGLKRVYIAPLAERGDWVRRTGIFDVVAGDLSDVDTSGAPATATIPADLAEGDRFGFNDFAGTWGTNALTINPNGSEFEDLGDGSDPSEPMTCGTPARFELVFAGGKLRTRF